MLRQSPGLSTLDFTLSLRSHHGDYGKQPGQASWPFSFPSHVVPAGAEGVRSRFHLPGVQQWLEEVSLPGVSSSKLVWSQGGHFCSHSLALNHIRQDSCTFSEVLRSLSHPCYTGPQVKPEKQMPPIFQRRKWGSEKGSDLTKIT